MSLDIKELDRQLRGSGYTITPLKQRGAAKKRIIDVAAALMRVLEGLTLAESRQALKMALSWLGPETRKPRKGGRR